MALLVWRGCLLPLSGECPLKHVKAYCLPYCKLDSLWRYKMSCRGKKLQSLGGRSFHFWYFHAKILPYYNTADLSWIFPGFRVVQQLFGWISWLTASSVPWKPHLSEVLPSSAGWCLSVTFMSLHFSFSLFNLKGNVKVHWDGEIINKHLLIWSAILFYC